jgi:hypothetical protein
VEDGTHLSGLQRILESDVVDVNEDNSETPEVPEAEAE